MWRCRRYHKGVVLITTLLLIAVINLLALALMESAWFEWKMADNFKKAMLSQSV